VSCKKSGFGDRQLGTQSFFFQVITQARLPHDREVDIAGNGRRPADILPKAWDGMWDLAVDLTTLAHKVPIPGGPATLSTGILPPAGPFAAVGLRSSGTRGNKRIGRALTGVGGWAWTPLRCFSTPGEALTGLGRMW